MAFLVRVLQKSAGFRKPQVLFCQTITNGIDSSLRVLTACGNTVSHLYKKTFRSSTQLLLLLLVL